MIFWQTWVDVRKFFLISNCDCYNFYSKHNFVFSISYPDIYIWVAYHSIPYHVKVWKKIACRQCTTICGIILPQIYESTEWNHIKHYFKEFYTDIQIFWTIFCGQISNCLLTKGIFLYNTQNVLNWLRKLLIEKSKVSKRTWTIPHSKKAIYRHLWIHRKFK